jgi:ABC-type multidrug transport system fused ATPase/permease subunit
LSELGLRFTAGPEAGRSVSLGRAVVIGRRDGDVVLDDELLSRSHVRFVPSLDGDVEVTDLDSTNGTWINGRRIDGSVRMGPRDVITIGSSTLELEGSEALADTAPAPDATPEPAAEPAPTRPELDGLAQLAAGAAIVRYRPGTAGEAVAPAMAEAVAKAIKRLAKLTAGSSTHAPQVCLVDPFPDPANPQNVVTRGTMVDAERGEIWMVVSAESPPEQPERALAMLYGSHPSNPPQALILLEGYGLHTAETPDTDELLRGAQLPPFEQADGDLRAAMALSFTRYLIQHSGEETFLRVLTSGGAGRLEAIAFESFGQGLAELEEGWRRKLMADVPPVKTGQFLAMSMRYLRPHRLREAEMFLFMLMGLAFTMIFPFAFKKLLDEAIPSGKMSEVAPILALLGGAFLISLLAGLRRSYLTAYVSSAVGRDVRTQMFSRMQHLDAGWFHNHDAGDVSARLFQDVDSLNDGLTHTLREGVVQALTLIVSAVILLKLNPLLGAIVLLGAPLVALVYKLMAKEAQRRSMVLQEQFGTLAGVATENYGANSVVRAFGLEGREDTRFGRASERLFKSELRLNLFGGIFSLSVELIVTVLRIAVLALGAYLIFQGHLTIGGLVAFTSLMGQALAPVTVLTGIGQQVQAATGSLVRINEVLEAVPEVSTAPGAQPLPRLERDIVFRDVGFGYGPDRRILENVSLRIEAGQRVAFVGPSGAGKSSAFNLIARNYDPQEGAVLFDGVDLREVTLDSVRAQIGVVLQETFLFNTSIRENIALGRPDASDAEIEAAAEAARLSDFVASLPEGYDFVVGERGGRLSGGQRQRVAIARALLRDPAVLLLDEATSALDPRTEQLISHTLEEVSQGRTTISITHRITSVVDYDRIFVIANGGLAEEGTHDELVALGGLYAELWAEQTGGEIPRRAPELDIDATLARLPLFEGLGGDELHEVAQLLRPMELVPGETLLEEGGQLAVVRRGSAMLMTRGLDGQLAPLVELGPGDSFGLSAVMGGGSGDVLRATGPVALLLLDAEALRTLADRFEQVADALGGDGRAAPAAGIRLGATAGLTATLAVPSFARDSGGEHRRPAGLSQIRSAVRPPMQVDADSRLANPVPRIPR